VRVIYRKIWYLILLLSQIGLLLQWQLNSVFLLYGRPKYVAVRNTIIKPLAMETQQYVSLLL
jgi:hypothetical protein